MGVLFYSWGVLVSSKFREPSKKIIEIPYTGGKKTISSSVITLTYRENFVLIYYGLK
jgi:hypothetical protein